MGATDELLLKLIAQDEASQALRSAKEQIDWMTDSEREAIKAAAAVSEAEKQAADAAEEMANQNKQAGISFTEINSAIQIGEKALRLIGQAYDATIGKTLKYADQVRDLGRVIGASAEESSKLIQAADDVGISAESLQSAMQAAIRKGISPTIDGLGKLADQYVKLPDQISKTKFLMDSFGRSGADLGALMEKGRAGLKSAGDEATRLGLVLSEKDVKAARELEIAQDNLSDVVNGFITRLGTGLIPKLVEVADGFVRWLDVAAGVATETEKFDIAIENATRIYGANSDAVAALIRVKEAHIATEERLNAIIETSNQLNYQHSAGLSKSTIAAMASVEAEAKAAQAVKDTASAQDAAAQAAKNEAAAQDAANKAADAGAISFGKLEQSLVGATKADLAKVAISDLDESLKNGEISRADYANRVETIGLKFGLMTKESIAAAKAIQTIDEYSANYGLTAKDQALALDKVTKAAADGIIKDGELGLAVEAIRLKIVNQNKELMLLNDTFGHIPRRIDVDIVVNYKTTGDPDPRIPAHAGGGIVGAAGGRVLTGEFGPERVNLPIGSQVHSSSQYNQYNDWHISTDEMGMAYVLEAHRLNLQNEFNQRMN